MSAAPSMATCVIFLKIGLSLLIGFSWNARLVTQVISRYSDYPSYMTFSDILAILCWSFVTSVLYGEWRRRLRHHWFLRFFWVCSLTANLIKLWTLLNTDTSVIGSGSIFILIQPWVLYGIVVASNTILCLLGIIGMLPKAAKYLECIPSPTKTRFSSVSWSLIVEFLRVVFKQKVVSVFIVFGSVAASGMGFIAQYVCIFWSKTCQDVAEGRSDLLIGDIKSILWCYMIWCFANGARAFFFGIAGVMVVGSTEGARANLMKVLLNSSLTFVESLGISTIVAHLNNDVNKIQTFVRDQLSIFSENLMKVIVGAYFMLELQQELTYYIISIVPLTFMITYHQGVVTSTYEKYISEWQAKSNAVAQDILSKFQSILIYNKKKYFFKVYCAHLKSVYDNARRSLVFTSFLLFFTSILTKVAVVMGLLLGTQVVGDVSYGNFVAFILFGEQVVSGMTFVLAIIPKMAEALGSSTKVLELLQLRHQQKVEQALVNPLSDDSEDWEFKSPPRILFDHVHFQYEGSTFVALDNICIDVPGGSQVALVGPSGSGKSTILRLLCGFLKPNSGDILFNNRSLTKMSFQKIARNIAFVSQTSDIFNSKICENVALGTWEDAPSFVETMAQVPNNLKPVFNALNAACLLDMDKERVLGDSTNMSVGQQQRIAIARAFYKKAKVIVLDEVTSALDQISEQAILEAIEGFRGIATVIMVAHRLHTIQKADIIFVVNQGGICAVGKHDDLMRTCDLYVELVNSAQHRRQKKDTAKQRKVKATKKFRLSMPEFN